MYELSLLLLLVLGLLLLLVLLVLLSLLLKGKHPTDAVSLVCIREA